MTVRLRRRAPGAGRPTKAPEARTATRISTRLYAADEARLARLRRHFGELGDAALVRLALAALEQTEGLAPPPDEDA